MTDFITSTGYVPGLIGRIAQFHGEYYSKRLGFGQYFEARVATELSEFMHRYNEAKDCIWSLTVNNRIEGTITIDAGGKQGWVHLRWFFLTDKLRGKGAGNYLMDQAMTFCRQNDIQRVYLDTVEGLDAARHLYEKYGFELTEEQSGEQWGPLITEQRFEVKL
jgi:GNAT superfamily N-acetyltransferase